MGCHKVGTALKTSRLTSLAQLPDPESTKYGVKGAKMSLKWAKKGLFSHTNQPYFGPSGSVKWAKLVSRYVHGTVPTHSTKEYGIEVYLASLLHLGLLWPK